MNLRQAEQKLADWNQSHVLQYFEDLTEAQQGDLLRQIEETDFSVLNRIHDEPESRGVFSPLASMELDEIAARKDELYDAGIKTIQEGKTAALLLAGGMGTRLGSSHPKGMYNIGITKPRYIFECLIHNLLDVVKASGTWIRLFVMTSEKNHDETVA